MNPEELKQKIAYYFSRLPAEAQKLFAGMAWLETLRRISGKFSLSDAQIETLGTETTLVLLGIISTEEYETMLANELKLPPERLEALLMEVNGLILNPVRVEIKNAFEKNSTEAPEEPKKEETKPLEIKPGGKPDYYDTLYEILRANNLTVAQMGAVEKLVSAVMAGGGNTARFEENLEKDTWLPRDKAHAVTLAINERIFKNIRSQMMAGSHKETAEAPQEIMKSAGIEVMQNGPQAMEEFPLELENGNRDEMLKKIEHPELIPKVSPHPIAEQKLAGAYHTPKKETEHPATTQPDKNKKVDPYREIPQ